MDLLEYLQELDRRGDTVIPPQITVQDVLSAIASAGEERYLQHMPLWIREYAAEFRTVGVVVGCPIVLDDTIEKSEIQLRRR